MKLISLNMLCGLLYEPLLDFIRRHSSDTDIFCFQEMIFGGRLYKDIAGALSDHAGYAYPAQRQGNFGATILANGDQIGLALFARRAVLVEEQINQVLYSGNPFGDSHLGLPTGSLQYATVVHQETRYCIGNIHGLWQGHKDDTPERLEQSRRLIEFFRQRTQKKILIGDFNLRPETKSIAMLSGELRNLVADYGISSTRTSEYRDMEKWKDYIADYAFVSRDTQVKDFRVLPDVVSDHAPLLLEI